MNLKTLRAKEVHILLKAEALRSGLSMRVGSHDEQCFGSFAFHRNIFSIRGLNKFVVF